jgi:hypothetical protein
MATVIKFPDRNKDDEALQAVYHGYKRGKYLELYIIAVRDDGTLDRLEVSRIAKDQSSIVSAG